ncbi:MAG TPA: hypothetical protein VN428_14745, partial [Bryobacteraceae bacterium]|nr:hypothetical protein [Bryobacteraceae bacterium]
HIVTRRTGCTLEAMKHALAGMLLLGTALWGQEVAPTGILKGEVIERGESVSGDVAIRVVDHRVFRLRYDAATYAERDGRRVSVGQLRRGETVEIIADEGARPNERYARRIRVLDTTPAPVLRPRSRRLYRSNLYADIFPRGNLTFSGTVVELSSETLLVRARGSGPTRFLLRDDTRFMSDGAPAVSGDLTVNTHVFVRAGKNLDGDLEVYQVVWGDIFSPRD